MQTTPASVHGGGQVGGAPDTGSAARGPSLSGGPSSWPPSERMSTVGVSDGQDWPPARRLRRRVEKSGRVWASASCLWASTWMITGKTVLLSRTPRWGRHARHGLEGREARGSRRRRDWGRAQASCAHSRSALRSGAA